MHPNSDEARDRRRIMGLSKAAQELSGNDLIVFYNLLDYNDRRIFDALRKAYGK